jgi:hypothetical protein
MAPTMFEGSTCLSRSGNAEPSESERKQRERAGLWHASRWIIAAEFGPAARDPR